LALVRVDEDAVEKVGGLERQEEKRGKNKSQLEGSRFFKEARAHTRWTNTHNDQKLSDCHTPDEISRATHFCHNLREDHGSSVREDHVENTVLYNEIV
jgi:hypothetical protein